MSNNTIYHALAHGLEAANAIQSPADVHGTLTGLLCANPNVNPQIALDDNSSKALEDALAALKELTVNGLQDENMGFQPLLPDDNQGLIDRVEALSRWTAGFLYGLSSQQAGDEPFDIQKLSAEAREIVNDFSQLSRVGISEEEAQTEAAEADFAELLEYLRVGVQMIFLELQGGAPHAESADTLSPTLH